MNYRLSPELALQDYFDELLNDGQAALPVEMAREAVSPEPVIEQDVIDDERQQKLQRLLQSTVVTRPTLLEVAVAETESLEAPVPVVVAEVIEEPQATLVQADNPAPGNEAQVNLADDVATGWHANGRPVWAQQRFEVLLFQVSGLTLAVPLMSLGQIQPLTDELTPLFGQADWFMGLLPTPSGKIRTVNTAKFVMPERYDENFLKTARYVVSINGVPWGLAVDSVNQPITLEPDDVKWRSERSKRPWLAGTVKEHMCALLDTQMMGEMLVAADKNAVPGN